MKRFLFIISLILVTNSMFASPTDMAPFKVIQPNGDSITIIQHGDEYGIWYETLDGYVVEKNASNYWVYVNANTNGSLVLTNQIANNVSLPTGINLTNIFNTIDDYRTNTYELFNNDSIYCPDLEDEETVLAIQQGKEYDIEQAKSPAKNKGTINVLTILIQFQDMKFEQPTAVQDYFDRLMNDEDFIHPNNQNNITGSVREYWEEVSYGQLSTNTIVVGPYTANNNIEYYRVKRDSEDGSIDASKVKKLVKEAIKAAAKDVNMQLFDNNNNGFVDFVHIVFAGTRDDIWPHQSAIFGLLSDWVWVSRYIITPEKENNRYASIGTICHEMGHAFGAPDFYDVDYGTNGEYPGLRYWDLMAWGGYNNNKNSPAHPNPYIKTEIFGWENATELSGKNRLYKLRPSELDGNSIYKISTSTPDEYYLLENRQDENLDGTGLLIYHITTVH